MKAKKEENIDVVEKFFCGNLLGDLLRIITPFEISTLVNTSTNAVKRPLLEIMKEEVNGNFDDEVTEDLSIKEESQTVKSLEFNYILRKDISDNLDLHVENFKKNEKNILYKPVRKESNSKKNGKILPDFLIKEKHNLYKSNMSLATSNVHSIYKKQQMDKPQKKKDDQGPTGIKGILVNKKVG